jgi:hypothetical protein
MSRRFFSTRASFVLARAADKLRNCKSNETNEHVNEHPAVETRYRAINNLSDPLRRSGEDREDLIPLISRLGS